MKQAASKLLVICAVAMGSALAANADTLVAYQNYTPTNGVGVVQVQVKVTANNQNLVYIKSTYGDVTNAHYWSGTQYIGANYGYEWCNATDGDGPDGGGGMTDPYATQYYIMEYGSKTVYVYYYPGTNTIDVQGN